MSASLSHRSAIHTRKDQERSGRKRSSRKGRAELAWLGGKNERPLGRRGGSAVRARGDRYHHGVLLDPLQPQLLLAHKCFVRRPALRFRGGFPLDTQLTRVKPAAPPRESRRQR